MTATLTEIPSVKLLERVAIDRRTAVDFQNRVIRNVKIVGLHSRNTARTIGLRESEFGAGVLDQSYSYSAEALREAIPLYEGARVKINHPRSRMSSAGQRIVERDDRGPLEFIGQLKHVHSNGSGLRGDLVLLENHPDTKRLLEIAVTMSDKLCLSHNARGVPTLQGGRVVITKILEVHSVDVVDGSKGGTTFSLFESFLLNGGSRMATDTMEMTVEELRDSVIAILEMPDLEPERKLEKIAAIFAPPEEVMESLIRQRFARQESHARSLLEAAFVPVNETNIAALVGLPNDQLRRKLIGTLAERRVQRPLVSRPLFENSYGERRREPGGKGLAAACGGTGVQLLPSPRS